MTFLAFTHTGKVYLRCVSWECKTARQKLCPLSSLASGSTPHQSSLGPSDFTSGCVAEETWNSSSAEYMQPCAHRSLIYNSVAMDVTQGPVSRWVDKKAVMQMQYNGGVVSHCKEWHLTICDSMDGPRGYYAEWSQSEKDKYHMFHL